MNSVFSFLIFFFFQAEDGIRDLVRSRGLGDVYKRQGMINAVGSQSQPVIFDKIFNSENKWDGIRLEGSLTNMNFCNILNLSLIHI